MTLVSRVFDAGLLEYALQNMYVRTDHVTARPTKGHDVVFLDWREARAVDSHSGTSTKSSAGMAQPRDFWLYAHCRLMIKVHSSMRRIVVRTLPVNDHLERIVSSWQLGDADVDVERAVRGSCDAPSTVVIRTHLHRPNKDAELNAGSGQEAGVVYFDED